MILRTMILNKSIRAEGHSRVVNQQKELTVKQCCYFGSELELFGSESQKHIVIFFLNT